MEIAVTAYARLHLGFLDLDGGLGRRFGSLGMAIAAPCTRLSLSRSRALVVEGREAERARQYLLALAEESGRPPHYRLMVEEGIPPHAGLGSGTQLALAVGTAYGLMEGQVLPPAKVGEQLARGARSGVGIGTFTSGGFVVDGGRNTGTGVPPVIAALPVPQAWRIVLLFDNAARGVHGQEELNAFKHLPPFPPEQAAHLCRLTLMQALPAVAEGDLPRFGSAVDVIQQTMGAHFAAAQGGAFYASPRVGAALGWLKAQGVVGLGQSSWGPTGFAFAASASEGQTFVAGLCKAGFDEHLDIRLTEARNEGAAIVVERAGSLAGATAEDISHGGKSRA